MADLPDGVSLATSFWGEPKSDCSIQAAHGDVSPSPFGVPYAGAPPEQDRTKKCRANNDTCNGWRLKDGEFCAGHAGVIKPPPDQPPVEASETGAQV